MENKFDNKDMFLITGGAGFIGSNLCESLIAQGYKVRCVDNLSFGSIDNIKSLMEKEKFEFWKGDIRDIEFCKDACQGAAYVLHQAALGSVGHSMTEPAEYGAVNVMGSIHMLEAARQAGVKKFVYASSSAVYGDLAVLPNKEGQEGELLSPYALTKKTVEDWAGMYKKVYGLDTYGLRYFNVYGPKQNPNGAYAAVIPRFITKLLKEETPVINGDGTQTRDFTYISDVIDANLLACRADSNAAGKAYNVAYGKQISILEVLKALCSVLDKEYKPIFAPQQKGDIKHSYADLNKIKEFLGYEGKVDFTRGLVLSLKWYQETLS